MDNLFELLPISVSVRLPKNVAELRLRLNRPAYCYDGVNWFILHDGAGDYVVSRADIDYILGKASGYSLYSVADNLIKGYLPYKGGVRIGVCGEGVTGTSGIGAIKAVTSLNIRVPREIKGENSELIDKIVNGGTFKNTLIVSPPAAGKTTLLREIARVASDGGLNVAVLDERMEIAASFDGEVSLDVGRCSDVAAGIPKLLAYEMLIRGMNPDVIVTDEIYGAAEVAAILDAMRAGVKVAASVHAESVGGLSGTVYERLQTEMDITVVLSRINRVGEVVSVVEKC